MEELKFCGVCLVTDVKMFSLDITKKHSLGLIYSHLAQIQLNERCQHACFECANLLLKYQMFKMKCLRAHHILSNISDNSAVLTKQTIKGIDRKQNMLESNLTFSPTIYFCKSHDLMCDNVDNNVKIFKNDTEDEKPEIEIKSEEHVIDENHDFNENSFINSTEILTKDKIDGIKGQPKVKEHKSKQKKINENIAEVNSLDVSNTSFENFDDNEFTDIDDNILKDANESITHKFKSTVKELKSKKRKVKTVIDDDDEDMSDNEPLSKTANKISVKLSKAISKKIRLNLEFDEYATVTLLTPEEAKKELLARKELKNYKISPFKCDFCYRGYEAKTAYENHMKRHSVENGEFECDICHMRFPKPEFVCKHKLSCHKRKFSCKLCPYVCYCMYQARTHVSLHKGKKYPCKDCGEIFSMPNSLFMHKRLKHLNETVAESVCELCGDIFGSPRGLFLHHHKLHRTEENDKQGPQCEECGVHFASELAWKRHLVLSARHTVANGCKYCGERFTNVDELKSHVRANHQRIARKKIVIELPAVCPLCKKWLTNQIEYKSHMNKEHPQSDEALKLSSNNLASFVCEVCGQAFKLQCFLIYHQRKHTGERPYKCEDCGKTFQMSGALSIHRTVHKQKLPFKCDTCAKVFSSKSALNKHRKLHLGIRPHRCNICEKGFLHMCDLRLHIKYVHDKMPWPKKKNKRNTADDNAPYEDYN